MQETPKRPGRKKGATVNKAQEIRKVVREMIDGGERPRPTKVVDILAAKGIEVSAPQVSMALRGTGMEYRSKKAAVNKSEQIRNIAKMMVAEGKPPRPVEIVEILKAKGIKVTSGQVSMTLKGSSLALRRPEPSGASSRVYLPDPFKALRQTSIKDLGKAKEFISDMGGIEKAIVSIVAASHVGTDEKQNPPEQTEDYYAGA